MNWFIKLMIKKQLLQILKNKIYFIESVTNLISEILKIIKNYLGKKYIT